MEVVQTGQTDGETREALIKSHFAQRIAELTNQLQMADSKAVHYNAEVRITYLFNYLIIKDINTKYQVLVLFYDNKCVVQYVVSIHTVRQRPHGNYITIEVFVKVDVTDAIVNVNRTICCHRTRCLRQDKWTLPHRVNGP